MPVTAASPKPRCLLSLATIVIHHHQQHHPIHMLLFCFFALHSTLIENLGNHHEFISGTGRAGP